jgi:hypothetical protein
MFSIPGSSSAWRATFQALRQDFCHTAEPFPTLRHAILQALDEEGTLPPSLEREMLKAGGYSAGQMRACWEVPTEAWEGKEARTFYLDWWQRNSPAKVGYLFGAPVGRERFEYMAERAWLALPGTPDGKAQAYTQPRTVDRWLDFVYTQLDRAQGSYLSASEELWVCEYTKAGRTRERRFAPRAVKHGSMISTGYPDADGLSERARRWIYTALATDPFTVSAVAIDILLAHPDPEGPYLVSSQEMDAYQRSPAFQNANFLVDEILLGEGRRFPIYRYWCIPAAGSTPSICPNADPPTDEADRKVLLEYLPEIAQRFRDLRLIPEDQIIHWVGRQTKLGTICRCDLTRAKGNGIADSSPVVKLADSPKGESRVVLRSREEGAIVLGKPKRKLTTPQYNVVKALLEAGEVGLTKDELVSKSKHGDARGILTRLAEKEDWKKVIHLAGLTGRRYRIK